jgi:hypothetical protein
MAEANLVLVERTMFGGSVRMVFDRDLSIPDVGRFVFEGAVPSGVEISIDMSQLGAFELTGVTFDVLRQMRGDVATWVATAPEIVPEGPPAGATAPPGDVPAEMDENELLEWVHHGLEGTHIIGHTAEVVGIFAREGTKLFAVAEVLGPIGMVASTIIVLWATARAFGTGTRLQEQEGFCYGLMWETFGLPDGAKGFHEWLGDSEDDLRQAFYDGVAQGREKAREVKVHNAIIMKVAYYQVTTPSDEVSAQQNLLNELWRQIRESEHAKDWLMWPQPEDMAWPFP